MSSPISFTPSTPLDSPSADEIVQNVSPSLVEQGRDQLEMLDLADLTDNLSVASIGEAAGSNTSESDHISSNLLRLNTKGCVGFFERLPLWVKIVFLVLFTAAGMLFLSAIAMGLSAESLVTSATSNKYLSHDKTFSNMLTAIQEERKAANYMFVDPTNNARQVDYLKSISVTEAAAKEVLLVIKQNSEYSDMYDSVNTKIEGLNVIRAQATSRLSSFSVIDMFRFYYELIRINLALLHRCNSNLGYGMDLTMLGLYHEFSEANILLTTVMSTILMQPETRTLLVAPLRQFVGERIAAERILLNSAPRSVIKEFQRSIVNSTERLRFDALYEEILAKDGNYSFNSPEFGAIAVSFLDLFKEEHGLPMFMQDITQFTDQVTVRATVAIVVVIVAVTVFAALSLSNTCLFARSIIGPWQRLNAVQEATISKFVPKGFLSLMGWKSIAQATLGKCLEQDMTVIVVKIADFSEIVERSFKDSEQVYSYVNSFLAYVGPYIRNNGGYIDKFSSNYFIAIFKKDKKGVRAALEIQLAMANFNKLQSFPISLRVTIVSGKTVMGTIGENERMESISISNTMKTAFRLQKIAKSIKASILTTKETLGRLPKQKSIHQRYIGNIKMRSEALGSCEIFELLTFSDPAKIKTKDHFTKAVRYLQASKLKEALTLFESISLTCPDDILSLRYRDVIKLCIVENVKRINNLTVSEVLQHPALRATLEQLCMQERSTENINLWNQIQEFKTCTTTEDRRIIANRICDEFLQLHGKQSVNLSEEQVSAVKKAVQNPTLTLSALLFVDIESQMEHLMTDTVKRLKHTQQFKLEFLNSDLAFKVGEEHIFSK